MNVQTLQKLEKTVCLPSIKTALKHIRICDLICLMQYLSGELFVNATDIIISLYIVTTFFALFSQIRRTRARVCRISVVLIVKVSKKEKKFC